VPAFSPLAPERLLLAFLVIGLAQELCKYAAVRYTVYLSREFDEPMDGVIYMTAVGVGFATHQNVRFLGGIDGEVFLSVGTASIVVTTLAHACFAGVLGYAMGRAKFATGGAAKRSLTLFLGLVAAAFLNGAFQLVQDLLVASGFAVTPWRGVAFAFGFAAFVFIVLSLLMQELLAISPHRPIGQLGLNR
jgi:RsiW-degrading membrane proteinase PrsW (M82 family)